MVYRGCWEGCEKKPKTRQIFRDWTVYLPLKKTYIHAKLLNRISQPYSMAMLSTLKTGGKFFSNVPALFLNHVLVLFDGLLLVHRHMPIQSVLIQKKQIL